MDFFPIDMTLPQFIGYGSAMQDDERQNTASDPSEPSEYPRPRRAPTVQEAKAVAHPLRVRILRLCIAEELTNKQLADRLGRDPGTVHYHVRQLLGAGLLHPAPVRTSDSGALEKPYRATATTWWLDNPFAAAGRGAALAPVEAFADELSEAGPDAVQTLARFTLHLSPEDVRALDRRILAILDEYVETDDQRRDQPAHGGIVVVHRLANSETRDPS